jgi:hypothetical protein
MNDFSLDLGGRLELMVDDYLIERLSGGAALRLHQPEPREIVIEHDQPWEGNVSGYHTIFQDRGRYRMYYRGWHADTATHKILHPSMVCYAESTDGIRWTKPDLGLCEFNGSRHNNIVWSGCADEKDPTARNYVGTHNFHPFLDANPAAAPDTRYKAFGSGKFAPVNGQEAYNGLVPFQSADGLNWSLMRHEPVITDGKFDSQNVAFFDTVRGHYRAYYRDFINGRREIKTATSPDFLRWTPGEWLRYTGAPEEQLYTNQVLPYYRAPHLFLGFPSRYVGKERGDAVEGLFMSSRDGLSFRRWGEAIIRPGLNPARWGNRSNYIWWGLVETDSGVPGSPRDLSLYTIEGYYKGLSDRVRRFTYRVDGFVSLNAPFTGGECLTKSLKVTGRELVLNVSTAAAGGLAAELQDESGTPIPGYTLADHVEFFGDTLEHALRWKDRSDLDPLAGRAIRLRLVLRDADVYSLRFR